jgi:RNA polymerase sigma-70 factor (ECF subfamily)
VTATGRESFETIAAGVAPAVLRYAKRRTDPETAEDILAETLLVLWRRFGDVPEGNELMWCYAVARNQLSNAERSARRQRKLVARLGRFEQAPASPPPELPDPAVHEALTHLAPKDRELLRLWAWEDLSPAQVAEVMGMTANAVSIRLHRARARLAEILGEERKEDETTGHLDAEEGRR